jgi:hypothetical protein
VGPVRFRPGATIPSKCQNRRLTPQFWNLLSLAWGYRLGEIKLNVAEIKKRELGVREDETAPQPRRTRRVSAAARAKIAAAHLLLGSSVHTRGGLMAGQWYAVDLKHAASGWLHFSPSEAARMCAEAIRRDISRPDGRSVEK